MTDCDLLDGELERNMFDWEPPQGVRIDQTFRKTAVGINSAEGYAASFEAVCACGRRSGQHAWRADAINALVALHQQTEP